ncbi:thiaminase II [Streptococcus dysgalactiae subsp. dysgalactiae]|uniref:thiaminase II n=1 Tax=Streptococcus dysgalactiae TaxID=1334 RepID=UPI003F541A1E
MLKARMIEKGHKYIDLIYHDDFIQGIISGELDSKVICHYLQADSVYLNKFADVYALCLAKATTVEDKRFFLDQIDFILNQELGEDGPHHILAAYTGKSYADIISESQWYPSADHYIKHMYYNIHEYGISGALSAMGPCPWIYHEVAKKIQKNHDLPNDHPFLKWVNFYADEFIQDLMEHYFRMIDTYAQNISNKQADLFVDNFVKSCQHERNFFQMAIIQEKWED